MKKWEVIIKSGYRFVVEGKDDDTPRIEFNEVLRKPLMSLGYDNKFGCWDAAEVVVCRPLMNDFSETCIEALKKAKEDKIP